MTFYIFLSKIASIWKFLHIRLGSKMLSTRSFFKLPLIFIGIYFIYRVILLAALYAPILSNDTQLILLTLITDDFISMIFYLGLYFLCATFLCNKYRLYHAYGSDLVKIIIIAILFCIVLWLLPSELNAFWKWADFPSTDIESYTYSQSPYILRKIINQIIYIFIMMLFFKLLAGSKNKDCQAYQLESNSGRKIYARLFSILLMTTFAFSLIVEPPANWLIKINQNVETNIIIHSIASLFFVILFYVANYFIVYFSTKNQFESFGPTLKWLPLFKSLIFTLLFLLVGIYAFSLVFSGVIFATIISYLYTNSSSTILFSIGFLIVMAFIINYATLYFSSRQGVKLIFGKKTHSTHSVETN